MCTSYRAMPVKQLIEGGRVPVKVFTDDLERYARAQLATSRTAIVFGHVARCPTCTPGSARPWGR